MGSQIAAHFANAGVPSLLLDVTAEAAAQGLKRARTLKPDPFFLPDGWTLVSTASFDEGLPRLGEADWIVECVVEQLDAKRARALYGRGLAKTKSGDKTGAADIEAARALQPGIADEFVSYSVR